MATRTQQKLDRELVDRFVDHRIWHFLRLAKTKGESKVLFHHPVGTQANLTYTALFSLLGKMGLTVTQARPECGYGKGIGLVEIANIDKVKTVLF